MFDAGLLNLGSLALGMAAWMIPALFFNKKNIDIQRLIASSLISFASCGTAICFQLFYSAHLTDIGDWSALMDTSYASAWISALLLAATVALNAACFVRYFKKDDRQ